MGRRRKSSLADDITDLVARLPWWVGVALAVVAYLLLHRVAGEPVPAARTGADILGAVPAMLWRAFALVGQYGLPFLCLLGALVSLLRRRKRQALFETAAHAAGADALQAMSWQEFEMLVGEGFKRRGYGVRENGGGGADGGVDLVLTKAGEKFLVQCKQWKAFKVGVGTVRELYGVMAADGAAGGFVVTSGQFTKEAQAFADGRNIQLMDGPALERLLHEARSNADPTRPALPAAGAPVPRRAPEPGQPAPAAPPVAAPHAPDQPTTPDCPVCARPMVRRVARRGATPGKPFWGCPHYTGGCRGTRQISDA